MLLPGKSHGRRSLVGCNPWGREELDTTERLHFHFSLSCIGEGNGNPLQCSCLENPRDRGACRAAISGVAQSQTQLKQLSSSSMETQIIFLLQKKKKKNNQVYLKKIIYFKRFRYFKAWLGSKPQIPVSFIPAYSLQRLIKRFIIVLKTGTSLLGLLTIQAIGRQWVY